ncbi:WxL protein peptidoglycan domain-containing protein [Oerskovia sp. NPDC060338]|uniref:WxL protein peptidoglycan domain-containing protein n=1 Tax=Oerskovia sp. NPDC060338 TaxID=3347100 RepID=UPI00365A8FFF
MNVTSRRTARPRRATAHQAARQRLTRTAGVAALVGALLTGALAVPAAALLAPGAHAAAGPVSATGAAPSGTVLAVAGRAAATASDEPATRTTWAVEPATAEGPDGRVSYRLTVDPGGQAVEHVTVTNFSDHPATFDVYASDGVVTADGQFDLLAAGTTPTDGGSWITLGEGETAGPTQRVEIAAESSATIPFTVVVPADATPGDHPAGVVAAPARAEGDGSTVTFDTRVGARLHLRVAGDLAPALALTDVRATYEPSWNPFAPGSVRVEYTVANEGNVRLGADTQAGVAGLFGWNAREVVAPAQREVLPGQEAGGSVVLDGVWPLGKVSGDLTTTPLVVGDDVVDVALSPTMTSYGAWALPWVQLGSLLVLVGLVLGVLRARRRREARTQARIEAAVAARAAQRT